MCCPTLWTVAVTGSYVTLMLEMLERTVNVRWFPSVSAPDASAAWGRAVAAPAGKLG
jgi:hypothetical protein